MLNLLGSGASIRLRVGQEISAPLKAQGGVVETSAQRMHRIQEPLPLVRLSLGSEGRIGLPPPPRTGELTVETMFGRTDEVITALTTKDVADACDLFAPVYEATGGSPDAFIDLANRLMGREVRSVQLVHTGAIDLPPVG